MKTVTWLIGVGVAMGSALALGGGCGTSVPTCSSICAFSDAPSNCAESCAAAEEACSNGMYGATFQQLVICVGNVGSFSESQAECEDQANEVAKVCGSNAPVIVPPTVISPPAEDGGAPDASFDSPITRFDGPITGFDSPIFDGPITSDVVCFDCDSGFDSGCEFGDCETGFFDGGNDGGVFCNEAGVCFNDDGGCENCDGGFEEGGFFDGGGFCQAGESCDPPGSTCVNEGAGPCGSDQQLECAPSGIYFQNGNTCNDEGSSCVMSLSDAGEDCQVQCTCENGSENCSEACGGSGSGTGIGPH